MTLENWNTIMINCLRSNVSKMISALFLISWIFIGNFILLNLFLAILLDGFETNDEEDEFEEETQEKMSELV